MHTWTRLGQFACLFLLLTNVARAQGPAPLELFPADCAGVVRFESVTETAARLVEIFQDGPLVLQMIPGAFNMLVSQALGLDSAEALDLSVPMYVCLPDARDPSALVIYAKAKDHAALLKSALHATADEAVDTSKYSERLQQATARSSGNVVFFRTLGDHVLLTVSRGAAERLDKIGVEGRSTSLAEITTKAAVEEFVQGEAGILINLHYLMQEFPQEIAGAKAIAELSLQESVANEADDVKDVMATMINGFFNRLAEMRLLAANVDLGENTFDGSLLITVQEDSVLEKFLVANPARPIPLLERLPANHDFYLGYVLEGQISKEIVTLETKENGAVGKLLAEADLQAFAGCVSIPEGDVPPSFAAMAQARAPEKLRELNALWAKEELEKAGAKGEGDFKPAAEQYKGIEIDVRGLVVEGAEEVARSCVVDQLMVFSLGQPEALHQLIDFLQSGKGLAGSDSGFQRVRKFLPQETNLIMISRMKDPLTQETTLSGISLSAHKDGLRIHIRVAMD